MTYQNQLKSHDILNNFISNQHINNFIDFPPKKEFSKDFIDWLSPKYFETFKLIYKKHKGTETQTKVIMLLSSPWYCNPETEDKIIDFLKPDLKSTLELSKTFRIQFETNTQDFKTIVKYSPAVIQQVLTPLNKAILKLDHVDVKTFKTKIIDHCLKICYLLKHYKPSDIEFTFSNAILVTIKDFNLTRTQQERYKACVQKPKTAFKISYVITVVLFLMALLRLITAFA